jgi:hypothetical protein
MLNTSMPFVEYTQVAIHSPLDIIMLDSLAREITIPIWALVFLYIVMFSFAACVLLIVYFEPFRED